jgi:hypothetical protein
MANTDPSYSRTEITRRAIRTPRAAAVAGILFGLLFTTSMVLIRLSIPEEINASNSINIGWLQGTLTPVTIALMLIPFAGIAFLWFMGVIRSRLGQQEDQFFSTVFFGSGLLFLAMIFASAAIAGAILATYAILNDEIIASGVLTFARAMMYTITNLYAIRMAGVFMLSLGTLWLRTGVMPRVIVYLTYALALLMLLAINLTLWLTLVFPLWVFGVSVYILIVSRHGEGKEQELVGKS